MQSIAPYLGLIGNIFLIISYFPQIKKTIVTRKSEDLSALMWVIILTGDLLMLIYSILQKDTIFVMLFTVFVIENLVMLYLTLKFKPKKDLVSARLNMEKKEEEKKEPSPSFSDLPPKDPVDQDNL